MTATKTTRRRPQPARYSDCVRCGWRSYPVPVPNGSPFTVAWQVPAQCGSCGAELDVVR